MTSFFSRVTTFFLPLRIAAYLGRGNFFSRERRDILRTSYRVLISIARNNRNPEPISLWFRNVPFTMLLESSADFALIREIFLDEEYRHTEIVGIKNIFDVGANVGAASIYFNCLYPEAMIYAFEPDPELFEKLASRVATIEKIQPLPIALSDTDGEAAFYRHGGSPLAGSLLPRSRESVPVMVATRTISSMASELGIDSIDLVKFDIEGAEKAIFSHADDRNLVVHAIGEMHLDLIDMDKESARAFFVGFDVAYTKQTAPNRYILWAAKVPDSHASTQ